MNIFGNIFIIGKSNYIGAHFHEKKFVASLDIELFVVEWNFYYLTIDIRGRRGGDI